MIYLDSRYADGPLERAWDARTSNYTVAVFREWPTYSTRYSVYEWVETDRLDTLAWKLLGNPSLWWKILDINPEILDATSIAPGTQLRIPNA
jgi:hypothetical protein